MTRVIGADGMAAPAGEVLREIERDLTMASEAGETRSFAGMRDEYGLGHEDLEQALDTLREHGKAVEDAPGEWRAPVAGELDSQPAAASQESNGSTPGPVVVSVGEPDLDERPPKVSELDFPYQPTVRLTMAIADALPPESLGALVKAGIDEAKGDGVPFWLEVV